MPRSRPTPEPAQGDRKASGRTAEEWLSLYNQGLEYRKMFGLEQTWTDLEAKFFSVSASCDTGPNVLASKGDTIISALSVPEVTVSVSAKTQDAAASAPLVASLDNMMLDGLEMADRMEEALTNSFLFGMGFIKLGFDSEYGFAEELQLPSIGGSLSQFDEDGNLIESGEAKSGMPFARSVLPHNVVVPWGTRHLSDAPQILHQVIRLVDDVKKDKKYESGPTSKLSGQVSAREIVLGYSDSKDTIQESRNEVSPPNEPVADDKIFIQLVEIMDRRTKRVIVIALDEKAVIIRDVVNTMQINNSLPWVEVCIALRTRSFWATPPAYFASPHQNELDDIHFQAKEQRRASILKLLLLKGALSQEAKDALQSPKPGLYVEVEDIAGNQNLDNVIKYIGGNANLNVLLHQESAAVEAAAREALGISKQLGGENAEHARTTAEEIREVSAGGEIRLGRKQKALRRAYGRFIDLLNAILATHWKVPQSVPVIGPDGQSRWEQVSAEILRNGRYTFKISFSEEHFSTPESRQRQALELYAQLRGDPNIDNALLAANLIAAVNIPGLKQATSGGNTDANVQPSVPEVPA